MTLHALSALMGKNLQQSDSRKLKQAPVTSSPGAPAADIGAHGDPERGWGRTQDGVKVNLTARKGERPGWSDHNLPLLLSNGMAATSERMHELARATMKKREN